MNRIEAIKKYDEMLDELGVEKLIPILPAASKVLRESNPMGYNWGFYDWCETGIIDLRPITPENDYG